MFAKNQKQSLLPTFFKLPSGTISEKPKEQMQGKLQKS